MNSDDHIELEATALFIHGVAATCNMIGVVYNWRRKRWIPFWGNLYGFLFHVTCAFYHLKDVKESEK